METTTDTLFTSRWSSIVFRGIASILFGIVALAWPTITLVALTLLFGAYAFVDGIVALAVAVQRGTRPYRWLLVVDGLCGIGAGVATLFWPGVTLLVLVLIIGARFVLSGGAQIAAALTLRKELSSPVLYFLAGIASLLVGVLTFAIPGLSALVLVTILGAYAFAFGIMMLVLAFRMRRSSHGGPVHAPA